MPKQHPILLLLACLSAAQLASGAVINGAVFSIEEFDGTASDSVDLKYLEKLPGTLRLDHTQKFQVSFTVLDSPNGKPFQPDQAFLRLTSVASGKAAYIPALLKDETLEIVATAAKVDEQLGTQGGEFDVAMLIGSSSPEIAMEWRVGGVEIFHRPAPDGNQPPAQQSRLEIAIAPKPEILHIHRVPEKRTSAAVSYIFMVISVLPFLGFLLAARSIGANFQAFPTSGVAQIYAIGFHLGIGALLVLYMVFWLELNLMQTVPIAAALEIVTLMLGAAAAATSPSYAASSKKQE